MEQKLLKDRIDGTGWALFFVMLGVIWLLPTGSLPADSWMIGMAIIICVTSVIRYAFKIQPNWFMVIFGLLAFAFGIDQFFNYTLPFWPVLFLVIGVSIFLNTMLSKDSDSWWVEFYKFWK